MEGECKLIILALTKFCFTSPGMFSLEGQPGCKWLYIDKACKSALGENPVMMNDVCMSERGYNINLRLFVENTSVRLYIVLRHLVCVYIVLWHS